MGESKYIEQLNKLIEDILSSKKETISVLQNTSKQIIEDITIFINSNASNPSETNIKEILSDYFIRQLRLKYQKDIINNISSFPFSIKELSNFFNDELININNSSNP